MRTLARFQKTLVLAAMTLAVLAVSATTFATHLRGISLTWAPVTGQARTAKFTFDYAQRWTYPSGTPGVCGGSGSCPAVGTIISQTVVFGDGSAGTASGPVTSVNTAEDWYVAELTTTHTYAGNGPYIAYFDVCCRISTLKLGHDDTMHIETLINFTTPVNTPPTAAMPALVTVPIKPTTGFVVVGSDIDRDPLTYRLSSNTEMYGPAGQSFPIGQPPGLIINQTTGQVTWNTAAITAAGYAAPQNGDVWTAQFMIEDHDATTNAVKSKTPVDVILKFVNQVGTAPTLTFTPAPPTSVQAGTPVTFAIMSADPDANARVTLNVTGLPAGATATNLNSALAPPVTSQFSWTPTQAQGGSHVITFTATDDTLQQTLQSITIFVEPNYPPTISAPATVNTQFGLVAPITATVADANGDALTVAWFVDGSSTAAQIDNVPASTSATNVTLDTALAVGAHTVTATVTDPKNASASSSTTVNVAKADQTISFAALSGRPYDDPPFDLSATASSNLPVSFSIVSGPATLSGNTVTLSGLYGQVTVRASQGGDGNYNAAASVDRTFTVSVPDLDVRSITLETRQWNGHVPTDSNDAVATYFSLPLGRPGYAPGPKTLTLFDNVSNQITFGGVNSSIGYHHHFSFNAPVAGQLAVRMGADFGAGGTLVIDGQLVQFRNTDMWWNGNYNDPSQYLFGTVTVTVGHHTVDSYGFENCCDGAQQAQYSYLGAPYKTFQAPPNTAPFVSISGPATVDAASTATYTFAVVDPDGGASFTVTTADCGVNGTPQGAPAVSAGGGSFDCSFPNGGTSTTVSVMVTDNDEAQSNIASLGVTVNRVAQTITFAQPADTVYGAADFAVAPTASSNLPVSVSASGTCTITGGTVHATAAGACTLTASQGGNATYAPAPDITVTVNVAKAAAAIAVSGYTGVYDGNAHGATGTATGVSGEDLSSLLTLGDSFTNAPGGTAHWTFAGNGNYNATAGDVAITITRANATMTVTGYTGVYNGASHGATGTATGVNGENLTSLLNLGAAFTAVPGGTAHWTFAGNGNYNAAAGDVAITITKAALTVTADNATKLLGAALPPFTAHDAGFVGGETAAVLGGTLTFTTAATAASPVGTYAVTPGGLTSLNYAITFVPGTLTVTYNVCVAYDQSKAKQIGSTIPIKLAACDAAGTNVSSPSIVVHATELVRLTDLTTGDVEDAGQANPDSNFRLVGPPYGYLFNLQTTGLSSGTYQLLFTVSGDPQPHSVSFQLK